MRKMYFEVNGSNIIISVSNGRPSQSNYTIHEMEGVQQPYDLVGLNFNFVNRPVSDRPSTQVPEADTDKLDIPKSFSLVKFAQLELEAATVTKYPELIRTKQALLDERLTEFSAIYKE